MKNLVVVFFFAATLAAQTVSVNPCTISTKKMEKNAKKYQEALCDAEIARLRGGPSAPTTAPAVDPYALRSSSSNVTTVTDRDGKFSSVRNDATYSKTYEAGAFELGIAKLNSKTEIAVANADAKARKAEANANRPAACPWFIGCPVLVEGGPVVSTGYYDGGYGYGRGYRGGGGAIVGIGIGGTARSGNSGHGNRGNNRGRR